MFYPSIFFTVILSHLSAFQLHTVPLWTSNIMKKDASRRGHFCVSARAWGARTRMCVMRVVMNKDVLCVELVVNHWQRWQLTDRQIDPRPPRERCLAPAHSSHAHARHATARACTRLHSPHCEHKDCQKACQRV